MKLVAFTVFAGILFAPLAGAQKLDLKLDGLAARASDKSEVDLDAALLRAILSHLPKDAKSPGGELFGGVQEVHVRNYEFDKAGAYSDRDLEPLRKQVSTAAGWSRILNVKEETESAEVYVQMQGEKVAGCLVLATEARELSVVHLVGTLTVAQIKQLADSHIAFNLAGLTGAFTR